MANEADRGVEEIILNLKLWAMAEGGSVRKMALGRHHSRGGTRHGCRGGGGAVPSSWCNGIG